MTLTFRDTRSHTSTCISRHT